MYCVYNCKKQIIKRVGISIVPNTMQRVCAFMIH